MTCAKCEQLEERVAWLEGELSIQGELSDYAPVYEAIKSGMGRTLHGAVGPTKVVLALYRARGRVLPKIQLLEAIPPKSGGDDERSLNLVSVWVCNARKGLGRDVIKTVWGRGFQLTESGQAKVRALIATSQPDGAGGQ